VVLGTSTSKRREGAVWGGELKVKGQGRRKSNGKGKEKEREECGKRKERGTTPYFVQGPSEVLVSPP